MRKLSASPARRDRVSARRSILLSVLLLVVAACVGIQPNAHPDPPAPSGLTTFHENGLVFNYPSTWRESHPSIVSSMSSLIAELATVDIPTPCATTVTPSFTETDCEERYHLEPGSIVVSVGAGGAPIDILAGPPTGATPMTIGGLPGWVQTDTSPTTTAFDLSLAWTTGMPGSTGGGYTIGARMRGPGLTELRGQLEALIASLHFDPPVVPLPTGPAAADAAVARALANLVRQSPTWGCFPSQPGVQQRMISAFINGQPLAKPELATCTTTIEATPVQLWRLTLTIHLPTPDPIVGSGQRIILWVAADGAPGGVDASP